MPKSNETKQHQLALDFQAPVEVSSIELFQQNGANVFCFASHIRSQQTTVGPNVVLERLLSEAKRIMW